MYVYHYCAKAEINLWPGEVAEIFRDGILLREAPICTTEDNRQVREDILAANPEISSRESIVIHSLSLLHHDPERKEQHPEPDRRKQALRHLAACRYYLPERLHSPDTESPWVSVEYSLAYDDYEQALDAAEELGTKKEAHGDYWEELALAAESLGMSERAEQLRAGGSAAIDPPS